ncbi:MAG: CpsB/CapC family capsule biosynthesis tyrosine phosphatase [Bacillota bacterium]|nr:CpsB/CapC family capsule biosynthesis tyrosine phosphatase [Bacillota bacterium]
MVYIDLHAHILPGLDDGPQTLEESLKMARMALSQGFNKVVATPHVVEGIYENKKELILEKTRELQESLKRENIPLEVMPGSEIHISDNILKLWEKDQLLTINNSGKYILLELPHFQPIPLNLKELIFTLSLKGVRTIIPHPERNISIQADPNILIPLIGQGALIQCTLSSINGHFGEKVQKTVEILIRHRMVHLLATDMHNTGGRLKDVVRTMKRAEGLMGKEVIRPMITSFPELILKGRAIETPEPRYYQPQNPVGVLRSLFQRLFTPGGQDKSRGM